MTKLMEKVKDIRVDMFQLRAEIHLLIDLVSGLRRWTEKQDRKEVDLAQQAHLEAEWVKDTANSRTPDGVYHPFQINPGTNALRPEEWAKQTDEFYGRLVALQEQADEELRIKVRGPNGL